MKRSVGYSGTPLATKLGLKAGARALVLHGPSSYRTLLGNLPPAVHLTTRSGRGTYDLIQFFTKSAGDLPGAFARLKRMLDENGALWISWPKRGSGVPTDLDENVVRDIGLTAGLVDVKVCAVDDIWSALKFVIRLRDRTGRKGRRASVPSRHERNLRSPTY